MKARSVFLVTLLGVALFSAVAVFTQSTVYRIQGDRDNDVNIQKTPSAFAFSAANGDATNQVYITVTTKDKTGNVIPDSVFDFWLSDATTCRGVTSTASSGTAGLLIGTGAGSMTGMPISTSAASPNVASSRVPIRVASDSTGIAKIGIIDSAKTLFVPCAYSILSGFKAGTALTAANYK